MPLDSGRAAALMNRNVGIPPAGFCDLRNSFAGVASKTQEHLGILALFATLRFDAKIEFSNLRYPVNNSKTRYTYLPIFD